MLAQFLDTLNLSPTREQARRRMLAERIAAMVEERGSIYLDRTVLAELDAGWQAAMRASCELALRERVQLGADPVGRVEVIANDEFARRVADQAARARRRAYTGHDTAIMTFETVFSDDEDVLRLPDVPLDEAEPVAATLFLVDASARPPSSRVMKALADIPGPAAEQTSASETEIIHFPVHVAQRQEEELGWFDLDVAPPEDLFAGCGEKLPLDRKSLPERKREPWLILDNVALESGDQ